MLRRLGASEDNILVAQSNLANTYAQLGQREKALGLRRDVYVGRLKFDGEEHRETLIAAYNYTSSLKGLQRLKEAKVLLRKTITVAGRVLGESDAYTLRLRWLYANCLRDYKKATLDDVAEAVETLESIAPLWKRTMGMQHPETANVLTAVKAAREKLRLRRASSD